MSRRWQPLGYTTHLHPPTPASGGLTEELLSRPGSPNRAPDSHRIPEAPRPRRRRSWTLGGGDGGSRGRPARGLPWHTRFRRVWIYTCSRQRVPVSWPLTGPHTLLTVRARVVSSAPVVGRRAGKIRTQEPSPGCAVLCMGRYDLTVPSSATGYAHAQPRLCTRVSSCIPCAVQRHFVTQGKGGGHICKRARCGQARIAPRELELSSSPK
ncbi:transmembrane gamma-carboxyglutamic acid protein 2 isoform X1 [Theropithecus gelada]|uniref:transmembrane gamma-carboxyglutamic acid protein 2 isoform X1 n=1 Tax=Theropithecus gelada TaxID=9565 RepID=UPI000DC1AF07|nr:transmembrane gamma-carboxyglutamic acid protein 2 isoform X1 [Theropithecus gelada]